MLRGMMLGGSRVRYATMLVSNGDEFVLANYATLVGLNLNQVVEITITLSSGITRQSTSYFYGGLHLSGLRSGSQINVINGGYIRGAPVGSGSLLFGGPAIRANFTGNLVLTNGAGYIYGGSPNGYAIQHNAGTTITWISGATRITGAVGT
jgi:hypothetical protein